MAEESEPQKKTERLHMLISPAEIEAIDSWRFRNRIGTRAEAVRRLAQMALRVDDPIDELHEQIRELYVGVLSRTDVATSFLRSNPADHRMAARVALLALSEFTKLVTPLIVEMSSMTSEVRTIRTDGAVLDLTKEADDIRKEASERSKMIRLLMDAIENREVDEDGE